MNERDRRFCEEYLIDLNATAAAIRAGFAPATARNAAAWIKPDNPTKPSARAEIDRLIAQRSQQTGISAERVIRELARIAFVVITDVIDPGTATLKPDATPDDLAAIAFLKIRGDEHEVRLADKLRALELLGKHLGLFTENVRLVPELPIIIDDA